MPVTSLAGMWRSCLSALLSGMAALSAGEQPHLRLGPTGLARPGLPLAIEVALEPGAYPLDAGPVSVLVTLRRGDEPLVQQRLLVDRVAQLAEGLRFYPVLPAERSPIAVDVDVDVVLPDVAISLEATQSWATSDQILADFSRQLDRLPPDHRATPGVRLLTEQMALAASRPTPLQHWQRLRESLRSLQPATIPGWMTTAVVDQTDGGVLPMRERTALSGDAQGLAIICDDLATVPNKLTWPAPPAAVTNGLTAAGWRVQHWYPAGDRHWHGAALRRLLSHIATLQPGRLLLVGRGQGANAAIIAAGSNPNAGLMLIEPAATSQAWPANLDDLSERALVIGTGDHSAQPLVEAISGLQFVGDLRQADWFHLGQRALTMSQQTTATGDSSEQALPSPATPATAFTGPFHIIVGDAGSIAERSRNRALAQDLVSRYVSHGHTAPPWQRDQTIPAEQDPFASDHHLILVGNPTSNQVVAQLAAAIGSLPLEWDHRSISLGDHRVLRAGAWLAVACLPHPRHPQRVVVVIDGHPQAAGVDPRPLHGLPRGLLVAGDGSQYRASLTDWWPGVPGQTAFDEPPQ